MYAILDIETTGGKYNEEGITEIAIYRFDGNTLIDQFSSLVNPEREIQPFVVTLTGINNNMLRNAPKFYEIAKRIIEITKDCIIVAHNAKFDNRILTTEFNRLGYRYERDTLCTVELSKKLIPNLSSYSLGKLVRSLGIPISDRHRAQGDAKATVELFKLLLTKDSSKEIIKQYVKKKSTQQLKPKLIELISEAPITTGVYYMHNKEGEIIYIGKSKNIKKTITQHFTNTNRKSKKIQLDVAFISYEITGSELIAQLKENEAIKKNKPVYNKPLQKKMYRYQLQSFKDKNGYLNLAIEKADGRKKPIATYSNYQQAKSTLLKITQEYNLCLKLNGLFPAKENCPTEGCASTCMKIDKTIDYNKKVASFLKENDYHEKHMLLIDKGREIDEQSVILIENGKYKGFGFFNLNFQINNLEILKTIITPAKNSSNTQHIIQSYLKRKKRLKIIPLPPVK